MNQLPDNIANAADSLVLHKEIARLNKVIAALIERAEQAMDAPQSGFAMFQSTIMLEDQVRTRTRELAVALEHNEKIGRDLHIANEQLERSEQRLRNIVEYAPIGMCIADMGLRYQFVNKAFCDMIGYPREELLQLNPMEITHADDRAMSRDHVQRLLNGGGASYQIEKRYIRKDGQILWVSQTITLLKDGQGNPCNLIGQLQDITRRKEAEEQLRLAAAVYNYSSQAMLITDAANRIVAINPAFTELTGYAAEDALGKDPRMLGSGRQGEDFYKMLWQTLGEKNHWEGELWNRKKSGELYAEWLSISVVHDDRGAVQNYVALSTDITEKKKAAELIWEHANYDLLTRLPNRRLFRDRLDQDIRKAERKGETMALLFIDLDYFKEVNDTLGHQMGDALLLQVAERLQSHVRGSDTVARIGGDEFTAILNNLKHPSDAEKIAQAMVDALASPFDLLGNEAHVSGSIGIALYPSDASNVEDLIKGADDAMYRSKNLGRNRYTCFKKLSQAAEVK